MNPEESPKRFDRIISILIQLQSKRVVKAQELADRFGVSLRTIYRDIRSLEVSGVPVYSEAGIGYSLVEGYRLPPIMFTKEEAASFIAAEKLMERFTDGHFGKHFQSAMFKMKSVLKGSEKDWIAAIETKVKISDRNELFNSKAPQVLEFLFDSIAEKKQLQLVYQAVDSDVPTKRLIEPVGIYQENNYWYVFAYCHLRNAYRNFRADRVLDIIRTDKLYRIEHKELDHYISKPVAPHSCTVRLLVDRKVAHYLQNDRRYYGFISEINKGDRVEMLFECDYRTNGFARWLLMFADYAEVVEPPELVASALELLAKMQARFKK